VEKALSGLEGVADATVSLAEGQAQVRFAGEPVDAARLVQVVDQAGYEVPTESVTLTISGMTCLNCVRHVTQALEGVRGVVDAHVELVSGEAEVRYVPAITRMEDMREAVAEAGYQVE
jgi:copper ion binding protein